MLDLNTIAEFSRANCGTICAFLVPANVLATLQTLIFTGAKYSPVRLRLMVGFASFYAVLMILHVYTWFNVGIVMMPTYILLSLGSLCLAMNAWAIVHPSSLLSLIEIVMVTVTNWRKRWFQKSFDPQSLKG
ncbi:putative membrane protein [Lyngbya aestuarii BL J]|uniref:Putative membrane protein n=1 Tax=Lyngbya aestuarii BL J TaxID=1348334 RepID=U7QG60_9CYAN|nr:hypothetical protein [Lyngbya aestuarii]ERT06277.1 putative membrane protein [Lyngbya aestuarii BL J]